MVLYVKMLTGNVFLRNAIRIKVDLPFNKIKGLSVVIISCILYYIYILYYQFRKVFK